MVKAVHWRPLATTAWRSTDRKRVLTVWERRRLNSATLEPDEIHTGTDTQTHTDAHMRTDADTQTLSATYKHAHRHRHTNTLSHIQT